MKAVPNVLSIGRMLLSFTLLFIRPLSAVFYIIYILCGVSDMLDGFIARKFDAISKLGARLDSIADFIMVAVLLVVLYPVINPSAGILLWMILIALIRIASTLVAKQKYGKFAMLHTLGNKLTGLMLFLFPLFLIFIPKTWVMIIVCILASLSALEELAIQLTSSDLDLDKKSLFMK